MPLSIVEAKVKAIAIARSKRGDSEIAMKGEANCDRGIAGDCRYVDVLNVSRSLFCFYIKGTTYHM